MTRPASPFQITEMALERYCQAAEYPEDLFDEQCQADDLRFEKAPAGLLLPYGSGWRLT